MPRDYNTDKYIFRHHLIPETNEGLDIGMAGLRFNVVRAASCAIDTGSFTSVSANSLTLNGTQIGILSPSSLGIVAVTALSGGAASSAAGRTLTAGANITVTNGDGVSGNPTIAVSGTIPVANGGTGLTTGTSGGILGYTAAGTLASSTLLTANALLLGGGVGATPTPLGSLGTTTTVLHGNAAGAPTFGAVSLTSDASGTLQAAQFPALTGDITTIAGALATTLKNTGPGATGPIGSATVTPVVTIDAQGRVTALTSATTSGVPSGAIVMIASGSCPSGYTEYTGARGRFIVGVPTSGTLAGTAGSAMTDLQNPSVTPTFTGSALATHNHQQNLALAAGVLYFSSIGNGTGTFTADAKVTMTGDSTVSTPSLISSTSAGTPAGTVSAVASNSLAPYIQLMFCQKT